MLILSARRSVDDRVRGLQAGGDDYLTKPFAFAELLARVQALVRRASRAPEPTTLTVDDLVLDLLSRRVTRGDVTIDLRPREFALLEYLMRNAGKVMSKTMILSHVWDYSFDPQTNIVDVLVSRLREKIDRRSRRSCCTPCEAWAMSSAAERESTPLVYGLRLGVWYATLFIAGSLAIVLLTYVLTSASLAQRDRQIIDSKLGTYAAAYDSGGLDGLDGVVRAEQQTAPERLFVRVIGLARRAGPRAEPARRVGRRDARDGEIRLSDGTLDPGGEEHRAQR